MVQATSPPAYKSDLVQQDSTAYQQHQQQQGYGHGQTQLHVQHPQAVHEYSSHDASLFKQQNPQSAPQQTIGNGPYAIPLHALTDQPAWVRCPVCSTTQMTRVEYVSGSTTHLWALGLCLCFCLGCIPYCVNGLKDAEQHCGQCNALLATYKRGSGTRVSPGAVSGQQPMPQKQ